MPALPDYDEALRQGLNGVRPLSTQRIALAQAHGCVLAEPIRADRDLPPFNRAQLDGYALRANEIGRQSTWPIVGFIQAGMPADVAVPPGSCVRIATGAPVPSSLDLVIGHEQTDRDDPVTIHLQSAASGQGIHPQAADARQGDVVLERSTVLRAHHLGIAAAVGAAELHVHRQPRVIVLTSGDEVVDPAAQSIPQHQIRNSNGIMLTALLHAFGGEALRHEHLPDEPHVTIDAVGRAVSDADVLVTIGGVSAGERDYFPAAFEAHAVTTSLRSAAIQPGKPIRIGCHQRANSTFAYVVALPGNPVSVLACAHLFLWPLLGVLRGIGPALPWRDVTLASNVKPNAARRAFRPAVLQDQNRALVPKWAGSGDIVHTAGTHGLLELPVQSEPVTAGATLRFLPWAQQS